MHELDPEHLWAFVQPAEKRKNVVWEIHYVGDEESLKRARRRFRNEVSSTARDVREVALETEVGAEATLNWSDAVAQVIPWAARTDVDTVGAAIYKLARDLGFASREEVSQGNQLTYRHALPRVLDRLDSRQAENLYAVLALRLERDQVPDNAGTGAFEDLVTTAVGIRERRALQGMIPEEWGWSLDRCDPR